jgi:hypothetical protein
MNLAMDSASLKVTANYPHPNLECTLTFKCISDLSISSPIIASSYSAFDLNPALNDGVRIVTYYSVSNKDF